MNIYDYPYIIYYKGSLPQSDVPSVAIVGARNCTEYGRSVAGRFAEDFADMGIQVISGMALGIDAAAQKGAVRKGGYSMAVLGCGVDICYPRTNIELYTQLESNGGIISEYSPGTPPKAGLFPMRNRIISAMSDALIVVEAKQKSGSLITADQALDQNRDVYVVMSEPLFCFASTTISASDIALIILFLIGNRPALGGVPGEYSEIIPPLLSSCVYNSILVLG
jgi:DNA processing protein